jgi:hypothetical protein
MNVIEASRRLFRGRGRPHAPSASASPAVAPETHKPYLAAVSGSGVRVVIAGGLIAGRAGGILPPDVTADLLRYVLLTELFANVSYVAPGAVAAVRTAFKPDAGE